MSEAEPIRPLTREEWLRELTEKLRPAYDACPGASLPTEIGISVGFPATGGTRSKKRTIGQCFDAKCSELNRPEIFIHPELADPLEVASTAAHELIHACGKHGHGREFGAVARVLGFNPPWTSTPRSATATAWLERALATMPDYPHGRLNVLAQLKRQSTRLLKAQCPTCGYTIRVTALWANQALPHCPICAIRPDEPQCEECSGTGRCNRCGGGPVLGLALDIGDIPILTPVEITLTAEAG